LRRTAFLTDEAQDDAGTETVVVKRTGTVNYAIVVVLVLVILWATFFRQEFGPGLLEQHVS